MAEPVILKSFPEPEVDMREILRYMGERGEASDELLSTVGEVLSEMLPDFTYNAVMTTCDITVSDSSVSFPFGAAESKNLAKHLEGCEKAVLFAATVGIKTDRHIVKYGATSPLKALAAQAIGAERIEALCDVLCDEIKNECGCETKSRFSPGYGDLSIEFQRTMFSVLDCPRKIGLTLNNSLIMSPTKSVTAIVGLKK